MEGKIRINDLARELEVKSKELLEVLPSIGVGGKKTHSSSVEPDEAEKIRKHFAAKAEAVSKRAREDRSARPAGEEIKPKFDLSKITRPGDVLKAIRGTSAPAAPAHPAVPKVAAPIAAPPAAKPPAAPAK
ncbi:MAG TPA: translation initiation factor IF-2 N-terminal domain-containing protein, partial [Terriglobales bacterium]|nr:translation initiation factor IF-2 N-terminal domain-containing protein [Terriglobales bacterium]